MSTCFTTWLSKNDNWTWFCSLRQKTQTCGFVCLTATPVDILYSLSRKIISRLRLRQTMEYQQKLSGLQRITKLAGEIWPKPSMKSLHFFSFLYWSIHCCISECFLNLVFFFIRAGWVDCWSVPNFLLIIDYTWHPIYPQKSDEQLKRSCKFIYIAR